MPPTSRMNAVPAAPNFIDLTGSDSEDESPSKSAEAKKQSVNDLTLSDDEESPIYVSKQKRHRVSKRRKMSNAQVRNDQLQKKANCKLASFVLLSLRLTYA